MSHLELHGATTKMGTATPVWRWFKLTGSKTNSIPGKEKTRKGENSDGAWKKIENKDIDFIT